MKIIKLLFIVQLFLLATVFYPKAALALGQMTEPIIINDALRGEEIQQEITAVNSDSTELKAQFTAEGDITAWVKFYTTSEKTEELDIVTFPSEGLMKVVAFIKVPVDIENGEYHGVISVRSIAENELSEDESGAAVLQKVDRLVTITVSDKEIINIDKTSVIPKSFDLRKDDPLNLRIIYDNQGNFSLAPMIRVKIKKDEVSVHDLIYPYPEDDDKVNPKAQHEIPALSIQTIGWETGKYLAELSFTHNGQEIYKTDFSFSVNEASKFPAWWIFGGTSVIWWLLLVAGFAAGFVYWQNKKLKKSFIGKELFK